MMMNSLSKIIKYLGQFFNAVDSTSHQLAEDEYKPIPMSFFSIGEQKYEPSNSLIRQKRQDVSTIEKTETFDKPGALDINYARLNHLESLQIPVKGKTVIDVGCGVGHLAQYFVKRGCDVFCVDGRAEIISELQKRYPGLRSAIVDVEKTPLSNYGAFDIVFCYGLLYHLEDPLLSLQYLASACKETLLLETCITDHPHPLLHLVEETATYSQSLTGIGCRPTPSYIVMALLRADFRYVYVPKAPPQYVDFEFTWQGDLAHVRDGHNLRQIFIASRSEIPNSNLIQVGKCI